MSTKNRSQMVCLDNGHVIIGNESELHEYDVSKDTWYALHEHELPVTNFALAVYRSQLLLVGGITMSSPSHTTPVVTITGALNTESLETRKIWHLDDKLGWVESSLSPMPSPRSDAAVVVDGDLLIVASGPGIAESNGVDIFDGMTWRPTVYVQETPWNPIDPYCHSRYHIDMTVHDGHLYLLSEYLNLQKARGSTLRFFGSISLKSLLDGCATWKIILFPDGHASNPISYNGHFISVVPCIDHDKNSLCVNVYDNNSSWRKMIGNRDMKFPIASPCIIRLPTQELMLMIADDAFVMSIIGM